MRSTIKYLKFSKTKLWVLILLFLGFFIQNPFAPALQTWQKVLVYVDYGPPWLFMNYTDGFGTHPPTSVIIVFALTIIYWYFIASLLDFIFSKVRQRSK